MPTKDNARLGEFTIDGAKLSDIQIEGDIQIEDEDLNKFTEEFLEIPIEYSTNFELTSESVKNLTILYDGLKPPKHFKPEGKSNNWYKMHGYKMNRRIGRKRISWNLHTLNVAIENIFNDSNELEIKWRDGKLVLCEVEHAEE